MTRAQFGRRAYLEVIPAAGGTALRIEGLRITFRVQKQIKPPNAAEVVVYNLSGSSRARLQEPEQVVRLYAGYDGVVGPKLLYQGDVVGVEHQFPSPESTTKLTARDGYRAERDGVVSLSYTPGVSALQVVRDMAKALGAPEKFFAKLKDQKFAGGFSFTGRAKDGLQQMLKFLGGEYTIQAGNMKVLDKGEGDNTSKDAVLVTPDSGLIGSPERILSLEDEVKAEAEKKKAGWKIRCLLRTEIEPGSWFAFASRAVPRATAFRVEKVEHEGDTHPQGDEAWQSVVEESDPGVPI
jgi:hypothetical protein